MKNAIVSICLFLLVLIFVGFSDYKLENMCNELVSQTQELEYLILKEDWEDSFLLSMELLNTITKNDFITSIYINHTEMDHLVDEAIKLSVFTQTKNLDEALASLHHLKYNADNLKKVHEVNLQNIL